MLPLSATTVLVTIEPAFRVLVYAWSWKPGRSAVGMPFESDMVRDMVNVAALMPVCIRTTTAPVFPAVAE